MRGVSDLWNHLWRWLVLAEETLLASAARHAVDQLQLAEERAAAIARFKLALEALDIAVPSVAELRAEWAEAEARGRARVTGDKPITEEKP